MLCILVLEPYAQSPGGPQKPKRKTKVETVYNKTKDETIARTGPLELWKPPNNSVSGELNVERVQLFLSFKYPGRKILTPRIVSVFIDSTSQKTGNFENQAIGDFEKKRALTFITSTGRYDFGEMETVDRVKGQGISRGFLVYEMLQKDLPLDQFTQIAQTEKAEIRIGDRKFKLTKVHLEAFRNFLALMREEGLEF
jgi:hypothetical protein